MKNQNWKNYLPYLVAIITFVIIATIYASPILENKLLYAVDTISGKGMGNDVVEYKKETGIRSYWTGGMFSGMPTYQITGHAPSVSWLTPLMQIYRLNLPLTIGLIFIYLAGFFILMRSFNINRWLSIVGAIAITFSSYFFIIIQAGHNNKVLGIAYLAPIIAGFMLIFQKRYVWGIILTLLFSAFGLTVHPQMTFYYFMLIGVLFFAELYIHIKEKRVKDLLIGILIFTGCVGLGGATRYSTIVANSEYVKETMRGGHSELEKTTDSTNKTKGLDLDYATQWSYGIDETFTLIIPNFKGGSSHYDLGENSHIAKELYELGVSHKDVKNITKSMPAYWGSQPFTSGPVYVGAIVLFLFILGLLIVKGPYKWALLVATLFSILLSWGKNFIFLTELFFNYFPMYDKFRAVSSILVVAEVTIPLLGFLAIKAIMEQEITKEKLVRSIYIATGITVGISLIFALFGGSFYDFTSSQDEQLIAQFSQWFGGRADLADNLLSALRLDRAAMLKGDAWRSVIFILLTAALLWLFVQKKIKGYLLILSLGVLVLVDMWSIDRRFLNNNDFVTEREFYKQFRKHPYEEDILKDPTLHYRVLNLATNTFNESRTSYHLKSIGGYHAAKLRRYQDLIDNYISKMNFSVLDMLNTRYIIFKDKSGNVLHQLNPTALGNAWFVDTILVTQTPNEECDALGEINLKNSAVTDAQFEHFVKKHIPQHDSLATIQLTSYTPDIIEYKSSASMDGIVVFSEIYYPYGWKAYIDDKPVEHFRANYTLRALNVPAGEHHIRFEFRPDSMFKEDKISMLFIILMYSIIVAVVVYSIIIYLRKKDNNTLIVKK